MTIADPSRYTVQFLPDGRLLARLDCNHGRGGYTAAEGVLALTPLARRPRMRCPPDSAATRFQTILARARRRMRSTPDGLLLLRGDTGSLQLRPVLTGVLWAVADVPGRRWHDGRPDDPSQYTVAFLPDGTLAIQADCHHATGTYTVDHSTIDLRIGGEHQGDVPARIAHGSLPGRSRPGRLPCLPRRQPLLGAADGRRHPRLRSHLRRPSGSNTRRGMIGAPVPASNGSGCEVPGRRGARSGSGRAPVPRSCVSPY